MSPVERLGVEGKVGFPRVSGDEPFADGSRDGIYKFSPRERG